MSKDLLIGYQNMVWRIVGYDSLETVFEAEIPFSDKSVEEISRLLQLLAASDLEPGDIWEAGTGKSTLLAVRPATTGGHRFTLMAGENPHYTASLWRSDELN